MTLPWTDPTFLHGAAMLTQLVHMGQGYLDATSGQFGGFAPKRLEFAGLRPVLGIAALAISALIRWWLTDARTRTPLRMTPQV